jgi:hypothetical protein
MLKLNRNKLRHLTGLLTGHWHLKGHIFKLGLPNSTICETCNCEDETAYTSYMAEVLAELRFCHLGLSFMKWSDYHKPSLSKVIYSFKVRDCYRANLRKGMYNRLQMTLVQGSFKAHPIIKSSPSSVTMYVETNSSQGATVIRDCFICNI